MSLLYIGNTPIILYFLLVYHQYNKLVSYQIYETNLGICVGYVIEYQ